MRIPSVEIQFGGKTRHLIYDYNALAELQDVAGTYQSDVPHLKALRAAIWAGLLAETMERKGHRMVYTSRTLDLGQVGDIMLDMSEAELAALVELYKEARGVAEPEPKADPTPANS
jgi:hypothetical protein